MKSLLRQRPVLIGVLHLLATPGAPRFSGDREAPLRRALSDARALLDGGCHALIVENFGDAPFFAETVPAETVATLALALAAVRAVARDVPVGVNVLRNDGRAALGLAAATGAGFVRVNVLVGAAVTDQGLIQGRAAELLRERARLAPHVQILADVHVKHATPLGRESIEDAARDARERGLADALVVSGVRTGAPVELETLARVRAAVPDAPLYVGSGTTIENATALLAHADGAIVGTWFKHDGELAAEVDPARVRRMAKLFRAFTPRPE
ncbi:MAG: BtpA/SgcQ family protein [Planctomycetes bacterium]|nr:BtpA/SgcQ family protein [Planctomycetota bacterium]